MGNDIAEELVREVIEMAGGFDGLRNMLIAAGATATEVDDGKDDLILRIGDVHLFTVHPDGSYSLPEEAVAEGEKPIEES